MAEGTTGTTTTTPNEQRRAPLWSRRNLAIAGGILVLLVIIVVVARYESGSERRRDEAILKSTLDRIVTAQEGFYYDSTHYTASLGALPTVKLPPGVHVQLFSPEKRSWWGIASHDRMSARRCVVWVGSAPASLPAEARGPDAETKPLCYETSQLSRLPLPRGS